MQRNETFPLGGMNSNNYLANNTKPINPYEAQSYVDELPDSLQMKEAKAWDKLKKYEEDGYDMSMHYDKFKTIGADAGKTQRVYDGFRKFTSEGATTLGELTGQDTTEYRNNVKEIELRENNWKQKQADTNPNYKTKDDVWNVSGGFGEASPYVLGGIGMGVSKAPTLGGRIAGDVARGATADAILATTQHGYKDNWDSEVAKEVGLGVVGQAAGTGIAHLISKAMPSKTPNRVLTDKEINAKLNNSLKNTKPTEQMPNQDDIAAKINTEHFGTVEPKVDPINTEYKQQVNDFFNPRVPPKENLKQLLDEAIATNTTDDFIARLPDNVNKEKIANSIETLKQSKLSTQNIGNVAFSNGNDAIAGGAVGGLESFATQRDYNNDGVHDYKDTAYGALVGAIGVKAARKLMPNLFKDANIDKNTAGMFVGAKPNDFHIPTSAYSEAKASDLKSYHSLKKRINIGGGRYINGVDKDNSNILVGIDKNGNDFSIDKRYLAEYDKGAFSDIATRKTMREIDDSKANLNNRAISNIRDNLKAHREHQIKSIEYTPLKDGNYRIDLNPEDAQRTDDFTKLTVSKEELKKLVPDDTYQKILKGEGEDYQDLYDDGLVHNHIETSFKHQNNQGGKLSEFIDHPELFKQYPELKNLDTAFLDNFNGAYLGRAKDENGKLMDIMVIGKNTIKDNDKSMLLHEIQHAIQSKEGWARGGNTDEFKLKGSDKLNQSFIDNASKARSPKVEQLVRDLADRKISKEEFKKIYNEMPETKTIKEWTENIANSKDPYNAYQRLWGEQQARATQARMNYTPEQRASEDWTKTLEKTEGKYNEPIIKYDDGVANSEVKADNNVSNFLKKSKEKIQAKIDNGEIPEKGRTVVSPYENGKLYYLGDSGKVYFQRGNKAWRETPNADTIKDVKYVAENGLNSYKKMIGEEDLRFEKALEESKARELEASKTYKMDHKAPNKDGGVRADDLTDAFSNDIYSKDAARLHGHGAKKMDIESVSVIQKVRNKPDAEVTIYRAIPKDIDAKINVDDWVTTSKEYAKTHGESALKGEYKVLEMKVKAKDLYTDGNSIHEWGYSPNQAINGMTAMSSPTLAGAGAGGIAGANNDLDGDGKQTVADILIGVGIGAAGTKGFLALNKSGKISKSIAKLKDNQNVNAVYTFKLNKAKDYLGLRDEVMKNTNKKMEDFALLHEQMKLLDEPTRKNMYKYMSGENIELDGNIKTLADNYIKEIDKQSNQLVDLGILEKAQADKYEGKYLHRRYEKDFKAKFNALFSRGQTVQGVHTRGRQWTGTKAEYEQLKSDGEIGDFFKGKIEAKRQDNGTYKFNQDWSKEQRNKWGEVDDIAFSLPETLMRNSEMIHHAQFLKEVLENGKYVVSEELEGYKLMQGKKFGALQGKYVRNDIAGDISEFNQALFGKDGNGFSSDFVSAMKTFLTYWKKTHTVYNPIGHLNNLLSNITLQYGAGINPVAAVNNARHGYLASGKVGELRRLQAKEIIGLNKTEKAKLAELLEDKDLKLWKKAQDAGLFGRSQLNDILMQYANPISKTGKFSKTNALKKVDEKLSRMYQGEDDIMRFSVIKALTTGKKAIGFDEAFEKVSTIIPDYTKPMSTTARWLRNSGVTPFISWTYHATPILFNQAKEHPLRIASLYGALYGINQLMGIDPFNEEDIPQQNFSMKRIPVYKNGNEISTVKVDRWIPHNDIFNPLDFIKNLASTGVYTPILEIPRNQNFYFGGKITNKEGAGKAYDLGKYAASQVTPDALDNVAGLIENTIADKKVRKKHSVIEPRSTLQELLKMVGVNTLTYNKNEQRKKAIRDKK